MTTSTSVSAAPAASAVAGHFGEFLQGRIGPDGPVALVTLPCPALRAAATVRPGPFALHQPGASVLTAARARAFLALLGLPPRGRFSLRLTMPPGGGAGASTAALVALARAVGCDDPRLVAAACIASEGASDPLMFPQPARLLWASRQGRVLGHLPPPPRFDVIGGFYGPPHRTDPADSAFPDIADLVADWPAACADAARAARLATASAERTLAQRGPADDPTAALADRLDALGWVTAHTGSARALLYRPGTLPDTATTALRAAGFTRVTHFRTGGER